MVPDSERAVAAHQIGRQVHERTLVRLVGVARQGWERIDWAWTPIIGLGLADLILSRRFGLRFEGWGRFTCLAAIPAAVALYYRLSRRSDRLAAVGYYIVQWLIFSSFGAVLTYLAARADLPLRDSQFAQYDRLLGFDWWAWTGFVVSHQKFQLLLILAYSTLLPQTIGSVIYFAHLRRPDRNDELLWTTMVAALITIVISALLPALGPHLKDQYIEWSATLAAIRTGSARDFRLAQVQGIITFPSFHTVGAILLMYAHRPPMPSFSVVLVLNFLMLLSVPSEGQHYLVDVISGAVVAAVAIVLVKSRLSRRASTE